MRIFQFFQPRPGPSARRDVFSEAIDAFIAAGNTVNGRPKKVVGKFELLCSGPGSHLEFEDGCELSHVTVKSMKGKAHIHFGAKSRSMGQFRVEESSIRVGSGTRCQRPVRLFAYEGADISIGSDCLLSNVTIRTCDQHSIFDDVTGERINPSRPVVIEDRVWLSEDAVIQKGVTIGANSIVGSNSVVTKSFPPGSMIAGIPARLIRSGVRWSRDLV